MVKRDVSLKNEKSPNDTSQMIYELLSSNEPCMIARFGSTELACLTNYLSIQKANHNWIKYIKGNECDWWWNEKIMQQMQMWSGFFPSTQKMLSQFCELMIEDMKELDLLGSWVSSERFVEDNIKYISKVPLVYLEPYWAEQPWSRVLKGKKVLVVHPFAETIKEQYEKRALLFKDPNVLPEFDLQVLQAVQSLGGEANGFNNWFEALDWMKSEIDKCDYDICLIGCGAYGFPLAAHVKRQGKKAIHLGGALQLLFGIKGKRWENPNYGEDTFKKKNMYTELMNEYWEYPKEKPLVANRVENGCYW